jgi:replicative DNA helicase
MISPNDIQAEQTLLGLSMLSNDTAVEVTSQLKAEHFYDPKHRVIFGGIFDLVNGSRSVDHITVADNLRSKGILDDSGGNFYIEGLTEDIDHTKYYSEYIEIIKEKYILRTVGETLQRRVADVYSPVANAKDLLNTLQDEILSIGLDYSSNTVLAGSITTDAIITIKERMKNKGTVIGVPSGFSNLDKMLNGLRPGHLVIIAARPSMGKSRFALNVCRNAAIRFKRAVAFFSLEMSNDQLIKDLLVSEAQVSMQDADSGYLKNEDYQKIINVKSIIDAAPIHIDDTAGLTLSELRAKLRRLKKNHGVEVAVIDYLQLMSAGEGRKNREQEISSISRGLKLIAKELDMCIVALSQLSRAVESRGGDKRPVLSDLRESGAIEQDADTVAFLYRPEYYGIEIHDELKIPTKGLTELIVRKHRHGAIGTVYLSFHKHCVRFEDFHVEGTIDDNPVYLEPVPEITDDEIPF